MYIDALNGKTVTRKTLLRYTLKSYSVNHLIRGGLWKNRPGNASDGAPYRLPSLEDRRSSWHRSSHMRWQPSASVPVSAARAASNGSWPPERFVLSFPTSMSLDSGLASAME